MRMGVGGTHYECGTSIIKDVRPGSHSKTIQDDLVSRGIVNIAQLRSVCLDKGQCVTA